MTHLLAKRRASVALTFLSALAGDGFSDFLALDASSIEWMRVRESFAAAP